MVKGYVFITGGNRGIGRAIVLRFARDGYAVYFTYKSRPDKAEETLRLVEEIGGEAHSLEMDVSDPVSVEKAYKRVSGEIPYLNVLVNNAGILHVGSLKETSLDEWEKVMRVNLTGAFIVSKTFLPLLEKAPWATIVNVSSIAGQTGNVVASTAYSASKAGLIGFTKRLAVELAPKIRVNAVAPSFVETDMVAGFLEKPENREKVVQLHPLRDIAKPEDIAEAVYFLATPASRFITGQILGINGGRYT